MAIRDIVTMGYGNGTFSPGVSKVVTAGYAIGEAQAPFIEYVRYRPRAVSGDAPYRPATAGSSAGYRPSRAAEDAPYRPRNPQLQ